MQGEITETMWRVENRVEYVGMWGGGGTAEDQLLATRPGGIVMVWTQVVAVMAVRS
jgi:hypothetical protein